MSSVGGQKLSITNLQLVLIALVLLMTIENCQVHATEKYCGQVLTDILESVCASGFYKRFKRCLQLQQDLAADDAAVDERLSVYKDFITLMQRMEQHAKKLNPKKNKPKRDRKRRLRRDGIADDCCSNGCAYSEILQYCVGKRNGHFM